MASAEVEAALPRMQALRADGLFYRQIAAQLDADGLPTTRGGPWHKATVRWALNPEARRKSEAKRRNQRAEYRRSPNGLAARARWHSKERAANHRMLGVLSMRQRGLCGLCDRDLGEFGDWSGGDGKRPRRVDGGDRVFTHPTPRRVR